MKKLLYLIPALILAGMFFYACQDTNVVEPTNGLSLSKTLIFEGSPKYVGGTDFKVTLTIEFEEGLYYWTWKVEKEAAQNSLSHFDLDLGECWDDVLDAIVSVKYSIDGNTFDDAEWQYLIDPSANCQYTNYVLKINEGTEGNIIYFQIVVDKDFEVAETIAQIKYGTNCNTGLIDGFGCEDNQECWEDETAWAAGNRYVDRGNWATYTPYVANSTVTLYAGQTMEAGTVHFSAAVGGEVIITITLNAGWRFYDDPDMENVKIQDYEIAPLGNPDIGNFAHKGYATSSLFEITVPANNFYGVHVDVEQLVDCPPVE